MRIGQGLVGTGWAELITAVVHPGSVAAEWAFVAVACVSGDMHDQERYTELDRRCQERPGGREAQPLGNSGRERREAFP